MKSSLDEYTPVEVHYISGVGFLFNEAHVIVHICSLGGMRPNAKQIFLTAVSAFSIFPLPRIFASPANGCYSCRFLFSSAYL